MSLWKIVFAFVFFVVVIGLWITLIISTLRSMVRWRKELKSPLEEIGCEIGRREEVEAFVYHLGKPAVAYHRVEFVCDDGRRLTFSLLPAQYEAIAEGDAGQLVLRNGEFVAFRTLTDTGQRLFRGSSEPDRVFTRIVKGK